MLNESWLALSLAPDIGPVAVQQLLNHFGNAEKIISASRAELLETGLTADSVAALRSPDDSRLRGALNWLQSSSHYLIHWQDDRYPPLLRQTGQSPPVLFVDGNPELLCMPQIAIVGSRNATAGGRETALDFAAYLAKAGLTITSGLAAGVDAAAHEGALLGGGWTSVRQAFESLVAEFGAPPDGSVVVDAASPEQAPADDILGAARGAAPDLGAVEIVP